jgi:hypothetical protein
MEAWLAHHWMVITGGGVGIWPMRTALHEVLACGVLVAYAPHFLESEIEEHAIRIAWMPLRENGQTGAPS